MQQDKDFKIAIMNMFKNLKENINEPFNEAHGGGGAVDYKKQ